MSSPEKVASFMAPTRVAPEAEEEERKKFAEHHLSLPPPWFKNANKYDDAVRKIKTDFGRHWNDNADDERDQILLFLYSRNYLGNYSQPHRRQKVEQFLQEGNVRDRMMLVLRTEGDVDRSSSFKKHYISTCIAIYRYFLQNGTQGFVDDMSRLTYYLRNQKFGSCFLQSACVCASYLLQTYQKQIPPPDASKFIRHHFEFDQLHQYVVEDEGGDSTAIYKLLIKQFFDSDLKTFPISSISAVALRKESMRKSILESLLVEKQPCLVAKFECVNFSVDREKGDKRCGYVRFTKWGEKGEFIPLPKSSDPDIANTQIAMMRNWAALCDGEHPSIDVNDLKAAEYFTLADSSSPQSLNASSTESSQSWDVEDEEVRDSFWAEESEFVKLREGEGSAALHAMVLLGIRETKDELYWVMQNSWSAMRIIEMSTTYLAESGSFIITLEKDRCRPRAKSLTTIQCCPCPVSESHPFERVDCESWGDALVFGGELNEHKSFRLKTITN